MLPPAPWREETSSGSRLSPMPPARSGGKEGVRYYTAVTAAHGDYLEFGDGKVYASGPCFGIRVIALQQLPEGFALKVQVYLGVARTHTVQHGLELGGGEEAVVVSVRHFEEQRNVVAHGAGFDGGAIPEGPHVVTTLHPQPLVHRQCAAVGLTHLVSFKVVTRKSMKVISSIQNLDINVLGFKIHTGKDATT